MNNRNLYSEDYWLTGSLCFYCGCQLVKYTTPSGTRPYYEKRIDVYPEFYLGGKKFGGEMSKIVIADGYGLWTIDHKIPQSRGGSDDSSNLVACCRNCNIKKRARTDTEYIGLLKERGAWDRRNRAFAEFDDVFNARHGIKVIGYRAYLMLYKVTPSEFTLFPVSIQQGAEYYAESLYESVFEKIAANASPREQEA